jgi:CspA family cold shock protein
MPPARLFGTIVHVVPGRSFAFIRRDDGGGAVFLHQRELLSAGVDGLREGLRLEFEIGTDRSGKPSAMAVGLLDAETRAA